MSLNINFDSNLMSFFILNQGVSDLRRSVVESSSDRLSRNRDERLDFEAHGSVTDVAFREREFEVGKREFTSNFYRSLFKKYASAHQLVCSEIQAKKRKRIDPIPFELGPFIPKFNSPNEPEVYIYRNCAIPQTGNPIENISALLLGEYAGVVDRVKVPFCLAASISSFVRNSMNVRMKEKIENKIILHFDAPRSTIMKVVQFMYTHKPLEFRNQTEARYVLKFADMYGIGDLVDQAVLKLSEFKLAKYHPDSLMPAEAFKHVVDYLKTDQLEFFLDLMLRKMDRGFNEALGPTYLVTEEMEEAKR